MLHAVITSNSAVIAILIPLTVADRTQIKQADVVLLGFPLLWSMPNDVRANDLAHYESVTDFFGPAMTWGMYSIGWLDVGDKVKADELFNKSYQDYVTQPFKVRHCHVTTIVTQRFQLSRLTATCFLLFIIISNRIIF